ncbi:MAG: heparan-alpha-glucosaminide N-acetyltransferase [Methylocystaceae bacterium]
MSVDQNLNAASIPNRHRAWEIDFLRGLSILLMVIYHTAYDLKEFYGLPVPYDHFLVYPLTKLFAGLFIALCAVSCGFSRRNTRRGLLLLLLAIGITVVTNIAIPGSNISFGILHLLGVAILLYPLLHKMGLWPLLIIGLLFIAVSFLLPTIKVDHDWLAPLGIYSANFSSVDYFPLFPWLGVFMFGIAIGDRFYPVPHSLLKPLPENIINRVGRQTLIIYLLHQPLVMGLLYLTLGPPHY